MKFMNFQAPALFSSTFKALNLEEKESSTFKDAWNPAVSMALPLPPFLEPPITK